MKLWKLGKQEQTKSTVTENSSVIDEEIPGPIIETATESAEASKDQETYKEQFLSKLHFQPYPGTLNLRVRKEDQEEVRFLEASPFILIEGFTDAGRSFGPAKCFLSKIADKVDGALILPVRTHYSGDVVELISPKFLREQLHLKDGDTIKVRAFSSTFQKASASQK